MARLICEERFPLFQFVKKFKIKASFYELYTLLNRLYGVWHCDCLPDTFVFKALAIETNLYGFLDDFQVSITKSPKECHWTPFYPPNTLREREYNFPVVRMFLREFSHKQWAETSVHRATHLAVTKMTIVNFLDNVLQHNFNKQF